MSGAVTKWEISAACTLPLKKTPPCRDDWVRLWMGESLNEPVACRQASLQILTEKKMQTYKIISHQKLSCVIFSCDAVFLHQGLYVFIHVHPLDCLFYLSLALEVAEVHIRCNIHQRFSGYLRAGCRSGCLTCVMVCPKLDMWRLYLFKMLQRSSIRCFSSSCRIWKKAEITAVMLSAAHSVPIQTPVLVLYST